MQKYVKCFYQDWHRHHKWTDLFVDESMILHLCNNLTIHLYLQNTRFAEKDVSMPIFFIVLIDLWSLFSVLEQNIVLANSQKAINEKKERNDLTNLKV